MKKAILQTAQRMGYDVVPHGYVEAVKAEAAQKIAAYEAEIAALHQRYQVLTPRPDPTSEAVEDPNVGPYMLDAKTFNPSHPAYDSTKAKNFPGRFYNVARNTERTASSRSNPTFRYMLDQKLLAMVGSDPQAFDFLRPQIDAAIQELEGDPDYANFQQKMAELDAFMTRMNRDYPGTYFPGSVTIEDARFLYYLVRLVKPKAMIQTGVSNGVSCAFITLAMKHNANGGKLYAIDLPHIYDPSDDDFHQDTLYGVLIPNGRNSGWLVPDGLAHAFECWAGDAKELLPKMLKTVGAIDVFYHDSDHTYDHMWFEFDAALPYLPPHGLIIADDIAWSTVTWDFAQKIGCVALNHCGSQGLIFL